MIFEKNIFPGLAKYTSDLFSICDVIDTVDAMKPPFRVPFSITTPESLSKIMLFVTLTFASPNFTFSSSM